MTNFDQSVDETAFTHESITNADNSDSSLGKKGYSYQAPPLMNGLVGWWPLHDETAQDYSGNSNNGTVNGATTGVAGRGGLQATSFDGTDDIISTPLNPSVSGEGTVSFWFKQDFENTKSENYISGCFDGTNSLEFGYRTDHTATINYDFELGSFDGTQHKTIIDGDRFSANIWYHICVVYRNSNWIAYVNGVSEEDAILGNESVGFVNVNEPLHIGGWQNQGTDERYFNGSIYGVRLYNRALSQSEIQTLYEWGSIDVARPPSQSDGGISYYSFNSSNANDQWGSNDGTVNGATYLSNGGPRNDGAYSFDGTDDYIDTGTNFSALETTSFTISGWLKYNDDTFNALLSQRNSNSHGVWVGSSNSANGVIFIIHNSSGTDTRLESIDITQGDWYHIVATYDGGEMRLFVNGTLSNSLTYSDTPISTTENAYIGANQSNTANYTPGEIDDVRIYDRALEPWEVFELYQYGTMGRDCRKFLVQA